MGEAWGEPDFVCAGRARWTIWKGSLHRCPIFRGLDWTCSAPSGARLLVTCPGESTQSNNQTPGSSIMSCIAVKASMTDKCR
jgi:hypothetical protein